MSPIDYIRNLVSDDPPLKEVLDRCLCDWEPEMPPTTILFAKVGNAIGDYLNVCSANQRHKIFTGIEIAMTDPDENLKTAMATGLIESLVTKADKQEGLWAQLEQYFGPISKNHALSWRKFGQKDVTH